MQLTKPAVLVRRSASQSGELVVHRAVSRAGSAAACVAVGQKAGQVLRNQKA